MVLGLSGISLLFSLGVTFGTFRINIMSFFVQAEQVNTNTAKIESFIVTVELLERQERLNIQHRKQLEVQINRLKCLHSEDKKCSF